MTQSSSGVQRCHTGHCDVEVAGGAVALLGVFTLAQPVLQAEDDGGPGHWSVSALLSRSTVDGGVRRIAGRRACGICSTVERGETGDWRLVLVVCGSGSSLPPNVLVAHKDGGHGHGRGEGRLKLGSVAALRRRLLIRNDCGQHVSQHALLSHRPSPSPSPFASASASGLCRHSLKSVCLMSFSLLNSMAIGWRGCCLDGRVRARERRVFGAEPSVNVPCCRPQSAAVEPLRPAPQLGTRVLGRPSSSGANANLSTERELLHLSCLSIASSSATCSGVSGTTIRRIPVEYRRRSQCGSLGLIISEISRTRYWQPFKTHADALMWAAHSPMTKLEADCNEIRSEQQEHDDLEVRCLIPPHRANHSIVNMSRMFNVDVTWQATTLMHHLDRFLRRKKNKNKNKIGVRKILGKRE